METSFVSLMGEPNKQINVMAHDNLKGILLYNLETLTAYVGEANLYANNTNPLLRIMNALPVSGTDPFTTWYRCAEIGTRVAKGIGFNTASKVGKMTNNCVFESTTEEYVTIEDGSYPTDSDWKNWSPVRIIAHTYENLEMDYLLGEYQGFGKVYLTVDIGLLGLQYWYWLQENKLNPDAPSLNQYLYNVVIKNTAVHYLDIAILNRLINRWLGRPQLDFNAHLGRVTLLSPGVYFDKYADRLKDKLDKQRLTLYDALNNTKLFVNSPIDYLKVGGNWITTKKNMWWVLCKDYTVLGRFIKCFDGLNTFKDTSGFSRKYIRHLNRIERTKAFSVRGPDVESTIQVYLAEIKKQQ